MKKIINRLFPKYPSIRATYLLTGLALLHSLNIFGQSSATEEAGLLSVFSIPLFNVLLGIIIFLLIIISVLGAALKNVAEATKDKHKLKDNSGKILGAITLLALVLPGQSAFAQELLPTSAGSGNMSLNSTIFYLLVAFIIFELLIIVALISSIKLLAKKNVIEEVSLKTESSVFDRFNASVAIGKEKDILLDHNYDGIHELDNDLPPWWKYGFYASIVFAFIYMIHYHVTATGDLQIAEYDNSVLTAQAEKAEFSKNNANSLTENNVTMLTDKAEITKGETIFKETCFACHGKFGEGGVGPNLTDDFWINGGSIKDIFATIKYGKPDKGMKSWEADLSALQIQEVTCYIKTIHGSKPANGKAPQGDLYAESTGKIDSLKTGSTVKIIEAKNTPEED